jgi:hypothetical protein
MTSSTEIQTSVSQLDIPLERDIFLRTLIRELSGTLQEIVGIEEAAGFISVVGQTMGDQINHAYKSALKVSSLSQEQVSQVLVDLKKRIQGDFYVIEQDDEKIVFGNRVCPFAEKSNWSSFNVYDDLQCFWFNCI